MGLDTLSLPRTRRSPALPGIARLPSGRGPKTAKLRHHRNEGGYSGRRHRGDDTGSIDSLLRGSKDAAIAFAVRSAFNAKYGRIGRMSDVSIDTARCEVRVRLELTGESTAVDIHVTNYRLEQQGGRGTVTIGEAMASREWMSELLRQFVIGRTFDIPDRAAAVVRVLL